MCSIDYPKTKSFFFRCPKNPSSRILGAARSKSVDFQFGFKTWTNMMVDASSNPLHTADIFEAFLTIAGLREGNLSIMKDIIGTLGTSNTLVRHFLLSQPFK